MANERIIDLGILWGGDSQARVPDATEQKLLDQELKEERKLAKSIGIEPTTKPSVEIRPGRIRHTYSPSLSSRLDRAYIKRIITINPINS
jgi:hypothetical protein